jgi:hypothetical protein
MRLVGVLESGLVVTRVFADEELARLREFPEISREELFRFFMSTPAHNAFVAPGRRCGPEDQLDLSVALCTLPWSGFVPDRVVSDEVVHVTRVRVMSRRSVVS